MLHLEEPFDASGGSVIFPSVSVGNVGQLAVDLLLMKLQPRKVGTLLDPAIMPFAGGNPFGTFAGPFTTCAEVFFSDRHKLVLFQIRSPVLEKTAGNLIQYIVNWLKDVRVSRLIILSGVYGYTSGVSEIGFDSLRIIAPDSLHILCSELEGVVTQTRNVLPSVSVMRWCFQEELCLEGGGISAPLFMQSYNNGIPSFIILKYTSDGDNAHDASLICTFVNFILKLVDLKTTWIDPSSWGSGFAGNAPNGELFN